MSDLSVYKGLRGTQHLLPQYVEELRTRGTPPTEKQWARVRNASRIYQQVQWDGTGWVPAQREQVLSPYTQRFRWTKPRTTSQLWWGDYAEQDPAELWAELCNPTLFFCLAERNQWEGETWRFYIPAEGWSQEQALQVAWALQNFKLRPPQAPVRYSFPQGFPQATASYTFISVAQPFWSIQDQGRGGYMQYKNIVGPVDPQKLLAVIRDMEETGEDPLYKGGLRRGVAQREPHV